MKELKIIPWPIWDCAPTPEWKEWEYVYWTWKWGKIIKIPKATRITY